MQPKQLGPIGGESGRPFEDYTIPADARLTAIHVFAEWVLDALRFEYAGSNGQPGGNPPVGGLGGYHHVFYLDEDEYLLGISGRCRARLTVRAVNLGQRTGGPIAPP